MFSIDDELTIHITRGDAASFLVTAKDNDIPYIFKTGEVVRIKVFAKKDCIDVAFQKDFVVESDSEFVEILLTEKETKIGEVISKPVTYWYEIELNPYDYPQTIVGYHEDGVKMFKLYPEGRDLGVTDIKEEDIPIIDTELSLTSERPVQNQAIARAVNKLELNFERLERNTERELDTTKETVMNELNGVKQECKRIDTVLKNYNIETESGLVETVIPLTTGNATCVGIKVFSNGINAVIRINALMWTSDAKGTWPIATLPEELLPLEHNEAGYDDDLQMFFNDKGLGITIGLWKNEIRMTVEDAEKAKGKTFSCQLPYALKKHVVNEAVDIRHGANGKEYSTSGEAVRDQLLERIGKSPAALILGYVYGDKYVEFDSKNKTVTFPHDTVVVVNYDGQKTHRIIDNSRNNRVASWASLSTSAICVYYNLTTEKLECKAYNFVSDSNYVLLCAFRTHNGSVSISAPYRWDGKLFNSEFETTIVNPDAETMCVKSVNHRGYGTAPENTLSAYKLSAQNGFKYVEADVSFTSDGVAVLLHDQTVDRTSNGTGAINGMTFEEVRALDFGSWKSTKYAGEKIPTFEEFIKLCKNLGLHPYIELKDAPTEGRVYSLIGVLKKYGMLRNCTWISFDVESLRFVLNHDTKARVGYLCYQLTMSNFRIAEGLKSDENEVFVDVRYDGIMSGTNGTGYGYNEAIASGIPVETWNINSTSVLVSTLESYPYISGVTSDTVHAGRELYKAYK